MALVPHVQRNLKVPSQQRDALEPGSIPQPLAGDGTRSDTRPEEESARGAQPDDALLIRNFDALIARYEKPLFNFVYQWIGDYEEARDLTQETFISAYKAREQFRGEARVHTWLWRIAHNHCKNRFKQRGRQREMEGPSLDAGFGSQDESDDAIATRDLPDWSSAPEAKMEQSELRTQINSAVNALAPEYREVLLLRAVEEMSYNEIAEVMGLTLEAVKTRLNRARAMVRQRVGPYYNL